MAECKVEVKLENCAVCGKKFDPSESQYKPIDGKDLNKMCFHCAVDVINEHYNLGPAKVDTSTNASTKAEKS